MAYTRGRCTNFDYCLLADARQDAEVEVGQDFVCPQCGKPLSVPPLRGSGRGVLAALMIIGGLLILICGAVYLGVRLGESRRLGLSVSASQEGKQFFSEEKNQKTFICCGQRPLSLVERTA